MISTSAAMETASAEPPPELGGAYKSTVLPVEHDDASCEDFSMKHGSKHNYSNNNNNNNDGDDDNNDVLIKRDLKAMSTGDAKSLPGNQQSDCGQTSRCNDLPVNGPSITSLSKTSVSEQCKQSNLVHSSVDDVIGATTPTRTTPSLPSPRPSSTDVVVNDDDYDEEEACDTPTSLSPSHSVTPSGTPSRATPGLPATPGSGSGSASSLSMATNRPAQTSSAYGAARAFAAAASGVSVTARCPPVREAVDPAKYITLSGDLDGVKYACSKCGNVYKWRKSLNKHWKEKHDGETPDPPGSSSAAARLAIATQHQQQLHGSTIGHHSQLSPSDGHGKHGVLSMISNGRSIYGGRTLTAIKTSPDAANLTSVVGSAAAASRHLKGSLAALNPSLFSKFTLNPRSTSRIGSQHQQQNSPLGVSGVAPSWSPHHPPVVEGMLKVPDFLGVSVAASGGAKLSSDLLRSPSYDMGQGQGQLDASGAASVPHRSEKPVDLSESSRPYRRPAMTNDGGDETDVLDLSKKNNDHVSGQWSVTPPVADELFAVQDEPLDFSTKVVSGGGGSSTVVNGFASAASLSRASSAAALGGQQHQQLFLASARFPQLDNVAPLSSVTRDVAAVDFVDRKFDVGTSSCAQCHVKFTSPAELNRHFSREHADVLHTMASDRRQPPGCSTGSAQLYRYLTNETPLPAPIMAHHGGGAGSDSTSCVVCGKWLLSRALASKHFDEQHSILGPNNPYRPSALQQAHSSAMSRLDIDEPPRKKTILDGRMNHVRSDSFSAYATGNQLHQGSPGLAMAGRMNGGGAVHAVDDFKSDLLLSQCDDEQTAIVIPQAPEDASSLMASGSVAPATSKIYISTAHQQQQQQQQPPQVPVNVRVGTGTAGRSRRAELLGLTASGSPASATGGSTAAAEALLPFKCPLCEYRARWPSEMTQHAKNHSDEKPFRCPQCSYRSKWKWDVVKHLKRCGGGNCTARDVIDMSASPMNGGGSGAGAVSNLASLTSGTSSTSTQRRRRFHTPSNRSVLLNAAAIQHQQLQHSQILQQHPQNVATVLPEQRNGPVQATENLDPRSSTSGFHNKQEAVLSGPSQVADRDMGEESGGNQSISSPNNHALKAAPEVKSELVPGEQLSTAAATHATPCNEASQTSVAGQFGQGLHYCGQCPFVGHSPAELRRHQRVHSDEKPYSCRTCSYSSKWKCDLKKHLRAYNHVSAVPLVYGGHGRKPSLPADWGLGRIGLADPRDLVGLVRDSDFFDQSFTSDSAAATGDGHAEGGSDSGRSTDDRSGAGRGRHQQGTGNGLAAGITTGGRLRCRRCDFEAVDITSFLQHKTIQHSGHQSAEQRVRDNVEIVGNSDMCHQTTSGAVTMESTSGGQHHHRRKSSKQIRVLPTSQSDEIDQNVGPEVRRTAAATSTELSATDEDHKLKKQNWDDVCDEDRFWKSLGLKCKNKDGRKPLAGILNCQSEIASGSTSVSGLTVRDQSGWNAGRLSASEEVASAVGSPAIGTPQLDDMIDCDNRSSVSGNTSGTDEMDVDYMEVDDSSRTSANGSRMNAVDGWSEPVDLCSRNVAHGDDHEHSGNTSPTGSQQQHPGSSCTASAVSTAPVRRHWSWSKGIEGCTWRTSLNGSSGPGSSGSAEAEDAASMSRRKRKLRTCDKCGYVTDNLTTLQRHTAKHGSTGRHRCNQCTYTVERQHILDYHIKIVHNGAGAPGGAIPASGSDACSMPSAPASPQLSDGENGVDRRALDEDMSTDDRAQPLTNTEQNSKAETDQDASDDVTKANQSSGPEQGDKQRARDDWPTKPPMPRASVGRSCIRCGFVSRSEAAAVRHRLTGHSGLEYFCGDGGKCDRRATTSRLLAAHRARTHQSQQQQLQVDSSGSGESKTAPGSGIGGTYACSECPYRSSSPSHVASHGRLHVPPDRPHRCPECTYSVDRRSLLGQHIRLHQQQQQQQQPQDDKQQRDTRETVASSSSSAEDKQKQTPRRLRCSECPFRCRSAGQLSRHRQRHATVREGRLKSMPATGCSYKCEQCSFCADVRNAIAHHRLLHGVEGRRHKQTTAARRRR